MANLRHGFKLEGKQITAFRLDQLAKMDPENVDGIQKIIVAMAKRATTIVQAGLEGNLDLEDLSIIELETLIQVRDVERQRNANLLAVSIASAIRTENLTSLIPNDLAPEVAKKKYLANFEERAWKKYWGTE